MAKYLIWAREQGQAVPSNVPQSLMASISPSPQLNPAIVRDNVSGLYEFGLIIYTVDCSATDKKEI